MIVFTVKVVVLLFRSSVTERLGTGVFWSKSESKSRSMYIQTRHRWCRNDDCVYCLLLWMERPR